MWVHHSLDSVFADPLRNLSILRGMLMWTSVRHPFIGICECIYGIWMESLKLCACGHRCLHVDTCPPGYRALMFRGRSCTQTGNAAFPTPSEEPANWTSLPLPDFLSQFVHGFGLTGRQGTGGTSQGQKPRLRIPPAASGASRSWGVATKWGHSRKRKPGLGGRGSEWWGAVAAVAECQAQGTQRGRARRVPAGPAGRQAVPPPTRRLFTNKLRALRSDAFRRVE